MRMLLVGLALTLGTAYAEDSSVIGDESQRSGAESVMAGAGLVSEGIRQAGRDGDVVSGAVALPIGAASVAAGSLQVAGGSALQIAGTPGERAEAAVNDLFAKPLAVTDRTIVAQPAPRVPYASPRR